MLFVGDVHGKFYQYKTLIHGHKNTFQVGDFGMGFDERIDDATKEWMKDLNQNNSHRFIRGNHDNVSICRDTPGYVPDGTYFEDTKIFAVGGAWSIDYLYRTEGKNWWADEEVSEEEFAVIFDKYVETKPEIMVTHDCPDSVATSLFFDSGLMNSHPKGDPMQYYTRTSDWLQKFFEAHQPRHWLFGHWHHTTGGTFEGTRFDCIGELDTIELQDKK